MSNYKYDIYNIDKYFFSVLNSLIENNYHKRYVVFELMAHNIHNAQYGVFTGINEVIDKINTLNFSDYLLKYLLTKKIISEKTMRWLDHFSFSGNIFAYSEGECFFPNIPVMIIEGSFGEVLILETMILSILNYTSAISTYASAIIESLNVNQQCIEMGVRRTEHNAAISISYASYVAGFMGTSNIEAGIKYNIPVIGTVPHSYIMMHDNEELAFKEQLKSQYIDNIFLVDTYDIENGIKNAISIAGDNLIGIRLDSGDIKTIYMLRQMLNDANLYNVKIVYTNNVNFNTIQYLKNTPVDIFGLGTALVNCDGYPTMGFTYKMVAKSINDNNDNIVSISKKSPGKSYMPGVKNALRLFDKVDNKYIKDVTSFKEVEDYKYDVLLKTYMVNGCIVRASNNIDQVCKYRQNSIKKLKFNSVIK